MARCCDPSVPVSSSCMSADAQHDQNVRIKRNSRGLAFKRRIHAAHFRVDVAKLRVSRRDWRRKSLPTSRNIGVNPERTLCHWMKSRDSEHCFETEKMREIGVAAQKKVISRFRNPRARSEWSRGVHRECYRPDL